MTNMPKTMMWDGTWTLTAAGLTFLTNDRTDDNGSPWPFEEMDIDHQLQVVSMLNDMRPAVSRETAAKLVDAFERLSMVDGLYDQRDTARAALIAALTGEPAS